MEKTIWRLPDLKTAKLLTALAVLCLGITAVSYAAVVNLDFDSKSTNSDTKTLNPKGVMKKGEQIGVWVESTIMEPQAFTLKVTGLKYKDCDVYVNSAYMGTKTSDQLLGGIDLGIPGSIADPDLLRCLASLKPRITAAAKFIQENKEPEPMRVSFTMGQAADWVRDTLGNEVTYRSVDVVIAPAGIVLHPMNWRTRFDAAQTARALTRACWLLQQARDRMYDEIKDRELANWAVASLTPVDFYAEYKIEGGKPRVKARLVNNCNLPITGDITTALPKGWKISAKSTTFYELKSGKTFNLSFDLIPPARSIAPPAKLPIAANVVLVQEPYEAKLKLKAVATPGATMKAPEDEKKT